MAGQGALPTGLATLSWKLLRGESRAEEKDREMMWRLWKEDWFVQYRERLDMYRRGRGPIPVYPDGAVEEVELEVDEWLAEQYPGYER